MPLPLPTEEMMGVGREAIRGLTGLSHAVREDAMHARVDITAISHTWVAW